MILRAFIYSIGIYILAAIVALLVAGIIMVIYKTIHRGETAKKVTSTDAKPTSD